MRAEVAPVLRRLTGDAVQAAHRLVAGGFDGNVAELCDIADTFRT